MTTRSKRSKSDTNLVINNTQPRAIFIPATKSGHRQQMLIPGQNDVPKAHFLAVEKNASVLQFLALGYLENLGEGQAVAAASGFDGLSVTATRGQLASISDAKALVELRDMTTSPALVSMANNRLRELLSSDGEDDTAG